MRYGLNWYIILATNEFEQCLAWNVRVNTVSGWSVHWFKKADGLPVPYPRMNQIFVELTHRKKNQQILISNMNIIFRYNTFENVVCKMLAICLDLNVYFFLSSTRVRVNHTISTFRTFSLFFFILFFQIHQNTGFSIEYHVRMWHLSNMYVI